MAQIAGDKVLVLGGYLAGPHGQIVKHCVFLFCLRPRHGVPVEGACRRLNDASGRLSAMVFDLGEGEQFVCQGWYEPCSPVFIDFVNKRSGDEE
jgi:hypothetical protein